MLIECVLLVQRPTNSQNLGRVGKNSLKYLIKFSLNDCSYKEGLCQVNDPEEAP